MAIISVVMSPSKWSIAMADPYAKWDSSFLKNRPVARCHAHFVNNGNHDDTDSDEDDGELDGYDVQYGCGSRLPEGAASGYDIVYE